MTALFKQHSTQSLFSFPIVTNFAVEGVDMPSQVIGTINVIPEPSVLVLLPTGENSILWKGEVHMTMAFIHRGRLRR